MNDFIAYCAPVLSAIQCNMSMFQGELLMGIFGVFCVFMSIKLIKRIIQIILYFINWIDYIATTFYIPIVVGGGILFIDDNTNVMKNVSWVAGVMFICWVVNIGILMYNGRGKM